MQTRQLGKDGPFLTEIGFGAWAIGGPWSWGWGRQDDADSIAAIHRALDLGINWIDTAAIYGLGHSEEVVAKAVEGRRDDVFIATKCGLVWDDRENVKNNLQPESIRKEAEASLRRLKTDVIDLYQIHWPDPNASVAKAWETMAQLKAEGKVRYIGVSNFDVPLLKKCLKIAPVQSLQPPYNLLKRKVESDILPFCRENDIGVLVYSPMASGLLTGKFDPNRLAPDDWRRKSADFKEPGLSKRLDFVEKLRPIAEKHGKTVGNLAIAWTLMNPAVTSAIVGARTAQQVEENVQAADWRLTAEELREIDQLLKEFGL
ncbi:general stress protein 69 [bacterium BMS3Abin05]|nr:general stress protein 69 [bacterium BMS3Abin05]GBE27980.1 general stress protein 69 [bacterium BMS3Bbin03]HDL78060.1 aldo/keto reductase [Bacteroidota bacterium]HDZ11827.1 aldo/keto reductase [Bacteroidota bacterium]